MENGPARAEFWKGFILDRCQYPSPDLLRDQLDHAEFTEFCECGCNSFSVRVDPVKVRPLLPPKPEPRSKGHAAIYEAEFKLADGKTLEIIIFANDHGHLVGVDVDCCGNSYPVPDNVAVDEPPIHTRAAKSLFRQT